MRADLAQALLDEFADATGVSGKAKPRRSRQVFPQLDHRESVELPAQAILAAHLHAGPSGCTAELPEGRVRCLQGRDQAERHLSGHGSTTGRTTILLLLAGLPSMTPVLRYTHDLIRPTWLPGIQFPQRTH